jgi:hypothetical protein
MFGHMTAMLYNEKTAMYEMEDEKTIDHFKSNCSPMIDRW